MRRASIPRPRHRPLASYGWVLPLALFSPAQSWAQDLGPLVPRNTVPYSIGGNADNSPIQETYPRRGGRGWAPTETQAAGWGLDSVFAPSPVSFGHAQLSLDSPLLYDAGGFVGLRQATPEDSTFKAGNLYLKMASISGSILHSDNVNETAAKPEAGTISILRLGTVAMYQFNDSLQLAVSGKLVYLPMEGKAGVSGFGIQDPLYALATRPIFRAHLTYELQAGDWDIRAANEFRIIAALPAPAGLGFDFREQSAAGQYVFHDTFAPVGIKDSFLLKENRTGASATRLLPTETRLTLGANRSYYWYDGPVISPYPTRRDSGYVALNSELEDLRFKPFAIYKIDRYDQEQYDHQQVRAGIRGPVTENVSIVGDGGYYRQDGGGGGQSALWDARIEHTVSPQVTHQISYGRYVTEPFGDLETRAMYSVQHQLNSVVSLGGSAYTSRFVLPDRGNTGGTQRGVNLGIRAEVFPEGGVELGGGWLRENYDNVMIGGRDTWLARARFRYKSLEAEVVYRFLDRRSAAPGLNYRENLLALTLSKYF